MTGQLINVLVADNPGFKMNILDLDFGYFVGCFVYTYFCTTGYFCTDYWPAWGVNRHAPSKFDSLGPLALAISNLLWLRNNYIYPVQYCILHNLSEFNGSEKKNCLY